MKLYDTVLEKKHVVIITEYAAKGSLYHYLKSKNKVPDNLQNSYPSKKEKKNIIQICI